MTYTKLGTFDPAPTRYTVITIHGIDPTMHPNTNGVQLTRGAVVRRLHQPAEQDHRDVRAGNRQQPAMSVMPTNPAISTIMQVADIEYSTHRNRLRSWCSSPP